MHLVGHFYKIFFVSSKTFLLALGPTSLLFDGYRVPPPPPKVKWSGRYVHQLPAQRAPGLNMSGAVPLLPLYSFVAWTRTNLPFLSLPNEWEDKNRFWTEWYKRFLEFNPVLISSIIAFLFHSSSSSKSWPVRHTDCLLNPLFPLRPTDHSKWSRVFVTMVTERAYSTAKHSCTVLTDVGRLGCRQMQYSSG